MIVGFNVYLSDDGRFLQGFEASRVQFEYVWLGDKQAPFSQFVKSVEFVHPAREQGSSDLVGFLQGSDCWLVNRWNRQLIRY